MTTKLRKKVPAVFYRTDTGNEPVREWLSGLDAVYRKAIGTDIMMIEYGWPIGMPVCRSMGNGLHEVRTDLGSKNIARVLFCFDDSNMILLHGFIKKTEKTPDSALRLARKRKREIDNG